MYPLKQHARMIQSLEHSLLFRNQVDMCYMFTLGTHGKSVSVFGESLHFLNLMFSLCISSTMNALIYA